MSGLVLLDTGPLVAYLDRSEQHHRWARRQFETRPLPFLTCEPVLAEAAHLLKAADGGAEAILTLVESGALGVSYQIQPEAEALKTLMNRYDNVPMNLADACLMRMNEQYADPEVVTLDSDFYVYRAENGEPVSTIMPPPP